MKISCPFRTQTKYRYSAGSVASCWIKLSFSARRNKTNLFKHEFRRDTLRKSSSISTLWQRHGLKYYMLHQRPVRAAQNFVKIIHFMKHPNRS